MTWPMRRAQALQIIAQHERELRDLGVARLMKRTCPHLTEEEAAGYGTPLPDARSKAGVRRFPEIVPVTTDMEGADTSRRAAEFFRGRRTAPSLIFVGMRDPVLGPPVMQRLRAAIRGAPSASPSSVRTLLAVRVGFRVRRTAHRGFFQSLERGLRRSLLRAQTHGEFDRHAETRGRLLRGHVPRALGINLEATRG